MAMRYACLNSLYSMCILRKCLVLVVLTSLGCALYCMYLMYTHCCANLILAYSMNYNVFDGMLNLIPFNPILFFSCLFLFFFFIELG